MSWSSIGWSVLIAVVSAAGVIWIGFLAKLAVRLWNVGWRAI